MATHTEYALAVFWEAEADRQDAIARDFGARPGRRKLHEITRIVEAQALARGLRSCARQIREL